MKNKLIDLNDHLFMQLERLNSEDLDSELLKTEVERAKAMKGISQEIIATARVALDAHAFISNSPLAAKAKLPKMLRHDEQ